MLINNMNGSQYKNEMSNTPKTQPRGQGPILTEKQSQQIEFAKQ